ncbi:sigma-70 family RNA polymerase sigma factor [bacterium]|nr:sigma-70 family RNA polymerase sigma factor [bacterium]
MKKSDNDIIDGILRGEEHGHAILLQRYRTRVYSLALRILRAPEEAEEAAQDAFIRAFRSLDRFERRSRFSTWLYRIAYNTALNRAAKLKRQPKTTETENDSFIDATLSVDARIEQKELKSLVEQAIERLRPEYAAILTLFYLEEQSYDEIADITGLPEGTVKNRLHRARAELRKHVLRKYSYIETTP